MEEKSRKRRRENRVWCNVHSDSSSWEEDGDQEHGDYMEEPPASRRRLVEESLSAPDGDHDGRSGEGRRFFHPGPSDFMSVYWPHAHTSSTEPHLSSKDLRWTMQSRHRFENDDPATCDNLGDENDAESGGSSFSRSRISNRQRRRERGTPGSPHGDRLGEIRMTIDNRSAEEHHAKVKRAGDRSSGDLEGGVLGSHRRLLGSGGHFSLHTDSPSSRSRFTERCRSQAAPSGYQGRAPTRHLGRQQADSRNFKKELSALDRDDPDAIASLLGSRIDEFVEFVRSRKSANNLADTVSLLSNMTQRDRCPSSKRAVYKALLTELDFFDSDEVTALMKGILRNVKTKLRVLSSDIVLMLAILRLLVDVVKAEECSADDAHTFKSVYLIRDIVRRCSAQPEGELNDLLAHLETLEKAQAETSTNIVKPFREKDFDILPSSDEILADRLLDVAPHEPSQDFSSSMDYIRYMFRIFREDFVTPLCSGVKEYVERLRQGQPPQSGRLKEVRAFGNVVFHSMKPQRTGVVWTIQLDAGKNHRKTMSSGAFKHGSLLCLSKDGFQTSFFAEVVRAIVKDLQQGHLEIRILDEQVRNDMVLLLSNTFVILESTAFFTAYNFTLQSLRHMAKGVGDNEGILPMARYLVDCQGVPNHPSYLETDSTMNFECLVRTSEIASSPHSEEHLSDTDDGDMEAASEEEKDSAGWGIRELYSKIFSEMRSKKLMVPVLQKELWPSCQTLGLDASQSEALRLAVSGELALIQGPPGTGKTTLGVKLTQVLLANGRLWRGRQPRPLLLLSYTNHALDQFLQLLLQTPGMSGISSTDIVRVGSGCTDPSLQRFTLTARRRERTWHNPGRHAHNLLRREMNIFQYDSQKFAQLQSGLAHEEELEDCMHACHYNELTCRFLPERPGNGTAFVSWLQLRKRHLTVPGNPFPQLEDGDVFEDNSEENFRRTVDGYEDDFMMDDVRELIDRRGVMLEMAVDAQIMEEPPLDPFWQEHDQQQRHEILRHIQQQLSSNDKMSKEEEEAVSDVWELGLAERWRLYRLWHWRLVVRLGQDLEPAIEGVTRAAVRLGEADALRDLAILSEARLVAMTTTGAARCAALLQQLAPPVVLVEEAAEIPEQHVLAALTPDCRHLVLIGDHCQLRPKPNAHALARTFHTDVSMFERLVRAGVQHCSLSVQHRMRPEISKLMVPHFYPHLQDHASVRSYPHVRGMKEDLFFLEHSHPETRREGSTSVCNQFEADFIAQLYRYLRLQGYKASDITILATYMDQVRLLRQSVAKLEREDPAMEPAVRRVSSRHEMTASGAFQAFCTAQNGPKDETRGEGVRVTSVDNFQGEEARIILLSLVRSNKDNSVGHLAAPNRTCVALSRAREGMYVVGNLSLLRRCSPVWRKLCMTATQHHQLGASLTLVCRRHTDRFTQVRSANDFSKVPDGGCHLPCDVRRPCGHACERHCHHDDPDHVAPCPKPCIRTCSKGHPCPKPCSRDCGPCMKEVPRKLPACGHEQLVPCCRSVEEFACKADCDETLECGHKCQKRCSSLCTQPNECEELVKFDRDCGHATQVACKDKDGDCPIHCGRTLDCGHLCGGTCGTCFQGRLHVACRKQCARKLVCGHICSGKCCQACPPCQKKCPRACSHSRCPKLCGEACAPCLEPCNWRCSPDCDQALQCPRLCGEVCQRSRCSRPCPKKLACRHPCRGLRCEPCPPCPRCVPSLTEIFFGAEDEPEALFYTLPDCRHTFEVTSLDKYMSAPSEADSIGPKTCPRCTTPVAKATRYSDVVRAAFSDIDKVKKKVLESKLSIRTKASELTPKVLLATTLLLDSFGSSVSKAKVKLMDHWLRLFPKTVSNCAAAENQLSFYGSLNKLNEKLTERVDVTGEDKDEDEDEDALKENAASARRLRKTLRRLAVWSLAPRYHLSEQSLREFQAEFRRLELLVDLLRLQASLLTAHRDRASAQDRQDVGGWLRKLEVRGGRGPTGVELAEAGKHLRRLQETFPLSGLGVSEAERLQIVRAMGFAQKGHWYKCPKGHVYAIGDCGGAMQQAACPECGAAIGGGSHRLVEDNALASEMDGAQFPAWSEQANLNNYVMDA